MERKKESMNQYPSPECPQGMLDEIMQYFEERNEDEFYQSEKCVRPCLPFQLNTKRNIKL